MKRTVTLIGLVTMICGMALAGDGVAPASTNIINRRTDTGTGSISSTVFYKGSTLLFTNCYMFTASGATQGLDEVVVDINIGNTSSNVAYTGNVYVVSSVTNKWWRSVEIPDITGTMSVQIKVTDANTNIYIYPWQNLAVKSSL